MIVLTANDQEREQIRDYEADAIDYFHSARGGIIRSLSGDFGLYGLCKGGRLRKFSSIAWLFEKQSLMEQMRAVEPCSRKAFHNI